MSIYYVSSKQDTFLVEGDIEAWLRDHGAKPRDKGGFKIGRSVVQIHPADEEAIRVCARIFPEGAAAKALTSEAGRAMSEPGGDDE